MVFPSLIISAALMNLLETFSLIFTLSTSIIALNKESSMHHGFSGLLHTKALLGAKHQSPIEFGESSITKEANCTDSQKF